MKILKRVFVIPLVAALTFAVSFTVCAVIAIVRHDSSFSYSPVYTEGSGSLVVADVNELKKVNDTFGHSAGDDYLRKACNTVCRIFDHSPVFRVGGDEFAVVAQGDDYKNMEELLGKVREYNEAAVRDGGIVIACGMSKFGEDDVCVADVLERADRLMYENKSFLKS
ncbi:MAG: GGDEF domain-containing protein [Clostridia bacterium]|nr:GGDEF domain-containing protein [Clostridia bacterium]